MTSLRSVSFNGKDSVLQLAKYKNWGTFEV